MKLSEFSEDYIWTTDYPVKYAGCKFSARMTVIRLGDGELMLHSPGPIDGTLADAISELGQVSYIVAPGSFHHMYVAAAQRQYPAAETHICPGIERKVPNLRFDWILGPRPPAAWGDTVDQALIRGSKYMWEVAMLHKPSKTLLLVDAIEYFTDQTANVSWQLKAWWKFVFRMWGKPKPAPEYQLGWKDKAAARDSLNEILEWNFDKIILSHGENITRNAKEKACEAWTPPLEGVF